MSSSIIGHTAVFIVYSTELLQTTMEPILNESISIQDSRRERMIMRSRSEQRNGLFQVCRHLKMCLLAIIILVVLDANQSNRYLIGARFSLATTREADVGSLITECTNVWPRYPPANRFACYRTRVKQFGPFQTCEATLVREVDITEAIGNENYTLFYVQTPGRLRDRTYVNRLLCRWDIQCPGNQLLYIDVIEHNIEVKQKSSLFRREVCVDYLKKFRDFGSETTCGYSFPYTDLEPRRMRIEFRSNKKLRFPGFRMRIACFNPDLQDVEGCSPTSDLAQEQKRFKRDDVRLENNDQDNTETREATFIKNQLHFFDEVAGAFGGRRQKRHTVKQIIVERSSSVEYEEETVSVVVDGLGVKYSFDSIGSLYTYNSIDGLNIYYTSGRKLHFRGRGILTVVEGVAYYVIYGVDPKFQPSSSEEEMIRLLMNSEEQLVADQDFIIDEEEESPTSTPTPVSFQTGQSRPTDDNIPKQATTQVRQGMAVQPTTGVQAGSRSTRSSNVDDVRGKRQVVVSLSRQVLDAAKTGATSCNAVLRAVSQSILMLQTR